MTNGDFQSLDEIMDLESHSIDTMAKKLGIVQPFRWELIRKTSRDNARTPMQWTGGENAGFTTGTPWLQINKNYPEINVERDMADPDGIHAFYKEAIALRKRSDILQWGDYEELYAKGSVYIYRRRYEGRSLTAVCNFASREKKLPMNIPGPVVLSNYRSVNGDMLKPWEFRLVEG